MNIPWIGIFTFIGIIIVFVALCLITLVAPNYVPSEKCNAPLGAFAVEPGINVSNPSSNPIIANNLEEATIKCLEQKCKRFTYNYSNNTMNIVDLTSKTSYVKGIGVDLYTLQVGITYT